jgi:poly(beta-D-mannuronate) lyase
VLNLTVVKPLPIFLGRSRRFYLWVLTCSLITINPVSAATQLVDSIPALQAAINQAGSGDTITLKNGTYPLDTAISVACVGTDARPVVIAAETVGGVEIAGAHGFEVVSRASGIVIHGFNFTHTSGRTKISGGASHVRLTRNTFQCSGEGAYLTVAGDNVEVDHNEFRDKKTLGNMISVVGTGDQVAKKLWIHHNYFHDFANAGGNGAETIRFGLSGLSMSTGGGVVEYNLFVRCVGENELISNKSCGNTYRYNTFLDSPGAQLTLRHGNDCVVYGNIFRGTDGLRIFGDRHQIFSNYFEGNTRGINLGNGGGEVADGAKLTSHDRPDNCVIAFNTLINNKTHYQMDGRASGLGATGTTFVNNLVQGGGVGARIAGPNTGAVWSGNLLWKIGDPGDFPESGYSIANPLCVPDADGIYRLQAGSPALDSAVGDYSAVTFDLDGQARPGTKKDKGADEFLTTPVVARLLSASDVGPAKR